MRHPLRRIESHARHVQRARAELGRAPSDRPDHSLDAGISPVSLAASRYAEQLDQYRPFYDQGRILLLTLEELSADPEATVSRVMKFLGLDPLAALERPEDENRAADKRRRARWWDALRAIPGLPWLATHLIPETARRRLDRAAARKVKVAGRFRLTPAEEETLLADLRPDLIRLRDVYGIDVERIWNIPLDAPIPASTPVSVQ
jgi:hypothetical protein